MNKGLLTFLTLFVSCIVLLAQPNRSPVPAPGDDTIFIVGKILSPAHIPDKVKVWKYNAIDYNINGIDIPVSSTGDFKYSFVINGPHQIGVKLDQSPLEFMATPKQKVYNVVITESNGQKKLEVNDSYENHAFLEFFSLSKELKASLDKITTSDLDKEENFQVVKKLLIDYQNKVAVIAKKYPQSFTVQVLVSSVMMPKEAFASIQTVREFYLSPTAFSNPLYYRSSLFPNFISPAYISLLEKKKPSFTGFEKALNVASVNPESSKLLQQVLLFVFTAQKKENLLFSYIKWSKAHPDKIFNPWVKIQLANLEGCIAGAPAPEIALNDPEGVTKRLGQTIVRSKVTLLIFYSPTCSHCQETLPKFLSLWNQYKDKGFGIYAVADNSTKEEWLNFINSKGTQEWTNVFETSQGVKAATKYMLNSIPIFILIDENGAIITRYATYESIKEDLPKYF